MIILITSTPPRRATMIILITTGVRNEAQDKGVERAAVGVVDRNIDGGATAGMTGML